MKNIDKQMLRLIWLLFFYFVSAMAQAQYIDGIVAVVEDDIILESELQRESAAVIHNLKLSNAMMPPAFIIRKQVLERLIVLKLQSQLAERAGIKVTEEMLAATVTDIARRNNMSLESFRVQLEKQGISYQSFTENVRNEIVINQLKASEIGNRVKVSDREVDHYLETQGDEGVKITQYHLGHILIATPDPAGSDMIRKARAKAQRIIKELRNGKDFKQMAITESNGAQALSGGDLGWRSISQVPTIFVDYVSQLSAGSISDPIRSPSGFHILKMLDAKGTGMDLNIDSGKRMITQTSARHILVKLNELINDQEAKDRLLKVKDRIANGEDFATLARAHSDDKASAIKGGDLGWVSPGFLVPPFEEVMNKLSINEVSDPVQTQFGWHMIQVLDRQERDDSEDYMRNQVREQLRNRKIEEETQLWLRKLRDEAFVEIQMDKL